MRTTVYRWTRPIHRPMWEASGGTLGPSSVVHTREFGTAQVGAAPTTLLVTSTVHTRAIGTPVLSKVIRLTTPDATGFKAGLTASQIASASVDWVDVTPENLWDDDAADVSVTLNPGQFSDRLVTGRHGFQIPLGAEIENVEVEYLISEAMSGSSDFYPGLTKNGTTVYTNDYVANPGVGTVINGFFASFDPAEINADTFGTISEIQKIGGSASTFSIDRIRIKIYYNLGFGLDRSWIGRVIPSPRVAIAMHVPSVVHTRVIGTPALGTGQVITTPPSVLHSRAIGSPTVVQPLALFPPSVIHTRAFGSVSVGPASNNPDMKQGSISMQPWDQSTIEHDKVRPKTERI